MMTYYDISVPLRSLLLLMLFLETCVGLWLVVLQFIRRRHGLALAGLGCVTVSGTLLILYTAAARAQLRSLAVPALSGWLCSLPVLPAVLVSAVVFFCCGYVLFRQHRLRRNTITRSAIREGIDALSSGLCFFTKDGRVILVNRRMRELSFRTHGSELQNGNAFWQELCTGVMRQGTERLCGGPEPSFRLDPEGTVWTFSCREVGSLRQLTAADTTRIREATEELKQRNLELERLNQRLRQYGEDVDDLTRSRERLETKAQIHRELGQALLLSRRYLVSGGTGTPPLDQWRSSIAMLRREAGEVRQEQPMEMLARVAEATGITTRITGAFPEDRDIRRLFVEAAAEALTNAIGHAHATVLYIDLEEDAARCSVSFRNDGLAPEGEVTEGGGLGSLRRKAEREGGAMTVESQGVFRLTLSVPKKRGERI